RQRRGTLASAAVAGTHTGRPRPVHRAAGARARRGTLPSALRPRQTPDTRAGAPPPVRDRPARGRPCSSRCGSAARRPSAAPHPTGGRCRASTIASSQRRSCFLRRRVQDAGHDVGHPVPVARLLLQPAPSGCGQPIEARLPLVVGFAPFALDETLTIFSESERIRISDCAANAIEGAGPDEATEHTEVTAKHRDTKKRRNTEGGSTGVAKRRALPDRIGNTSAIRISKRSCFRSEPAAAGRPPARADPSNPSPPCVSVTPLLRVLRSLRNLPSATLPT